MPGDAYLWAWYYFPGPSDNITSLVTVAAFGLSADHCSLATACSPASRKAACFHHQSPPVHRCSAISPPPTSCITCTAPVAIQPIICFVASARFPVPTERREKDVEDQQSAASPKSSCFLVKKFLRESAFWSTCLCHAQLISRSLRASQVSPWLRLASTPTLSLLPAIYLTGCYNLPCECAQLPSGTAVILNS